MNLQNGTLEIDKQGRCRLREHRKEDYFASCLPYCYDEGAQCEGWHRFLDRVLPDGSCQRLFQEFMVNAMASGDPVNLGYLMGSNYTRGFPGPVQEFNRNFLALPALPSRRLDGACDDAEVVLRRIDAGEAGDYYALVHTGWTPKADVRVRFPEGVKRLVAPATGEAFAPGADGAVALSLQPWQLLALRAE